MMLQALGGSALPLHNRRSTIMQRPKGLLRSWSCPHIHARLCLRGLFNSIGKPWWPVRCPV